VKRKLLQVEPFQPLETQDVVRRRLSPYPAQQDQVYGRISVPLHSPSLTLQSSKDQHRTPQASLTRCANPHSRQQDSKIVNCHNAVYPYGEDCKAHCMAQMSDGINSNNDIGIHVFAVLEDKPLVSCDSMIISISNGKQCRQYGPVLDDEDKCELKAALSNDRIKSGSDILWHAVDLKRILATENLISPLRCVRGDRQFKVWEMYEDNEEHRRLSREIANMCAKGPSQFELSEEVIKVQAIPRLIKRYEDNLPLFRLKWMEIQGLTYNLEQYELNIMPITPDDGELFDSNCTRLQLIQNNW
jgi:hypothetical protein